MAEPGAPNTTTWVVVTLLVALVGGVFTLFEGAGSALLDHGRETNRGQEPGGGQGRAGNQKDPEDPSENRGVPLISPSLEDATRSAATPQPVDLGSLKSPIGSAPAQPAGAGSVASTEPGMALPSMLPQSSPPVMVGRSSPANDATPSTPGVTLPGARLEGGREREMGDLLAALGKSNTEYFGTIARAVTDCDVEITTTRPGGSSTTNDVIEVNFSELSPQDIATSSSAGLGMALVTVHSSEPAIKVQSRVSSIATVPFQFRRHAEQVALAMRTLAEKCHR